MGFVGYGLSGFIPSQRYFDLSTDGKTFKGNSTLRAFFK
jgi:hypothetical protein